MLRSPLGNLGEHAAARTLFEDTLTRPRATLGPDHTNTLTTAMALGWTLGNLGEHAAARTLFEDTLTRQRATLGPDHTNTLTTAMALGWTLDRLGKRHLGR
ncbi:tetratricopeptide repeat protein [Frankia sp. B2]|uniref:tetratricopeptide repeat protein n=1 Tax=Frankia sp. B2 TaxID=2541730 RepID=UPI001F101C33|nr:tetratricopeptide repeat protein [Frankia sp. B2]